VGLYQRPVKAGGATHRRNQPAGWERPDVPVPPSASLTVFGAEQTPIADVPLVLAS
jgi:hypothetical protein